MGALQRAEAEKRVAAYHDALERAMADPTQFEAVFNQPPQGLGAHEIDSQGIIRRVNAGELALLGYTRQAMLGQQVSHFIVMQEASQRAIEQRLEGARDTKPFLRAFRRADGSAATMLLMVRLIRGAGGQPTGIRTVMAELAIG